MKRAGLNAGRVPIGAAHGLTPPETLHHAQHHAPSTLCPDGAFAQCAKESHAIRSGDIKSESPARNRCNALWLRMQIAGLAADLGAMPHDDRINALEAIEQGKDWRLALIGVPMTAGHRISIDTGETSPPVYRWICECARTGPWTVERDGAVRGGSTHAAAEARRQVRL